MPTNLFYICLLAAHIIICYFDAQFYVNALSSHHLNRPSSKSSIYYIHNKFLEQALCSSSRCALFETHGGNKAFVNNHLRPTGASRKTQLESSHENDGDVDRIESASNENKIKLTLLGIIALSFGSITALAKMNMIGPYPEDMVLRDMGMATLSTVLALIFVKTITSLASNGVIEPRDSRKIIHSFSAPLFMLFWPLFSSAAGARLFAATVPLLQAVRLWLAALDKGGDDGSELAAAISRSGDAKEALGGPFIYVVVLFVAIIACFRDNFTGMMALSAMAAGDGMADIFGRRFGKSNKWFFNQDKSMAGTCAFIVASSLCAMGLGYYFQLVGAVPLTTSFMEVAVKFVVISVLSAFIELVPIGDDNWSVPISAGVLSLLLL